MKSLQSKKVVWKSILSVAVLSVFILFSTGSYDILVEINNTIFYDEPHDFYSATMQIVNLVETIAGDRDEYGNWQGQVVIEKGLDKGDGEMEVLYGEKTNMVNGKRHGKTEIQLGLALFDFYFSLGYLSSLFDDSDTSDLKSATDLDSGTSAFEILTGEYPCFWYTLYAFDYDSTYMMAYLDTLETILNTEVFEEQEFDTYYQGAVAVLEETPYDSIISANSLLSIMQGMKELKRSELRMAVIDRYRSDGSTTFGIVQSTYPGYLLNMHEGDVTDQDFEEFCRVLDSSMTSYGPLDVEDPYFLDSIDVRMFRVLNEVSPDKKSTSSLKHTLCGMDIYHVSNAVQNLIISDSTPEEVAEVVLYFMYMQFDQGDIMKKAVKKSWYINHEVTRTPTVATEFSGGNSGTGIILNGYVIEDGGASVTSRGIAWGESYNPTTDNNTESSGTGTGLFFVTLEGLTEGSIYYARTFATNSAGTAYGNCIKFTATESGPSGKDQMKMEIRNLNIFPNPASDITTFNLHVESPETIMLTILNLKGQTVYHRDLGRLPAGEHQVELDLSGLRNGMYYCHLTCKGESISNHKFVIVR